jgi:hypothetical protein
MLRTLRLRVLVPLAAMAALMALPAAAAATDCGIPGSVDPSMSTSVDFQGDIPASKAGGYLELPFTVDPGTTAIRIRYSYDQPGGLCTSSPNTLDMGVYEPKGAGDAFWPAAKTRGWSGSAVKNLAIAENGFTDETTYNANRKNYVHGFTTRAYRPGPIPAGTWAAELGIAYIDPSDTDGIHYHVRVETSTSTDWSNDPYEASGYSDAAAKPDPGWYAGDLHVHGEQEPGNATMTQTFKRAFDPISAGGAGLDFVTLVDHNNNVAHDNLKSYQDANPGKLIIPGTEMTTYRGHFNNQGKAPFVDFRTGPIYTGDNAENQVRGAVPPSQAFAQIQANGNWTQINHPTIFQTAPATCRGCAWGYSDAETDFSKVDAIEVQTGPAAIPWTAPAGMNPFTQSAIDYYEHALDTGAHIAAVGSSDDHQGGGATGPFDSPVGSATTVVHAEQLSEQGITDGVKGDHTYVKLWGADAPDIGLTADVPAEPTAIIGDSVSGPPAKLTATVSGTTRPGRQGDWSLVLIKDGKPAQTVPFSGDATTQTFDGQGPGRYSLELLRTLNGVDFIEDYSSPIWLSAGPLALKAGKLKRNTKKGTAKLSVTVPHPGPVALSGKGLAKSKKTAKGAGTVKLKVKPKGKLKKKLAKKGKAKVKAKIAYTPAGGVKTTLTKKLKLKRAK